MGLREEVPVNGKTVFAGGIIVIYHTFAPFKKIRIDPLGIDGGHLKGVVFLEGMS